MEVDGRGAFDIPVTNLKGLVSRSLSDILAFVYSATGGKGFGVLNGCRRMDWEFFVSN